MVRDNLIGTDLTGVFDLGNALEGVRIEDATDAQILGDGKGSQVISGNHQGVVISGATATRNLVQGNLIGSDKTGLNPIPNAYEGVAILGAPGNTIGGTTASAQNLISANHWGVRLDGTGAVNNLVQGNLIGPDITGKVALGDEVNGVIVSSGASNNTIGGTASALAIRSPSMSLPASRWSRGQAIRSSPTASIPTASSASTWSPETAHESLPSAGAPTTSRTTRSWSPPSGADQAAGSKER